ncbi:MAG: type II toxin-antitoxin system PemK/MazF family toxin [Chitinispirillaceae bacterium]|nr:type II toxin-antitoxin system PemK/MazF family toxin [Chitinispirillaceae bacterium]
MVIKRGEIWWAELPIPEGSEPGYRRPVLVLQSDDFNRSAISTVIVAAITSTVRLAQAPGNVLLLQRISRLDRESVVVASQIVTIDKSSLVERVSKLPETVVQEVEDGIRLALAL